MEDGECVEENVPMQECIPGRIGCGVCSIGVDHEDCFFIVLGPLMDGGSKVGEDLLTGTGGVISLSEVSKLL